LAKEVEEIDLILGGHDHISVFIEVINWLRLNIVTFVNTLFCSM
jgi:hypothetical protein